MMFSHTTLQILIILGGVWAQQGDNLQKFNGSAGGITAPKVVKNGDKFDVVRPNGSYARNTSELVSSTELSPGVPLTSATLNDLLAALIRSCDAQFNACADAFNTKKQPGTSLPLCDAQKTACTTFVRAQRLDTNVTKTPALGDSQTVQTLVATDLVTLISGNITLIGNSTSSNLSTTDDGNLQKFPGAAGGIKAPKVVRNGDKFNVIRGDGSAATLNRFPQALIRSCDAQFNACADAFNLRKQPGTSLPICDAQKTACIAFCKDQKLDDKPPDDTSKLISLADNTIIGIGNSSLVTNQTTSSTPDSDNLQKYSKAAGGIPPPKVVKNGDKYDVVKANGSTATLNTLLNALIRSCDVQFNACADAFNLRKTPGTSLPICDAQKTECTQFNRDQNKR